MIHFLIDLGLIGIGIYVLVYGGFVVLGLIALVGGSIMIGLNKLRGK